MRSTHKVAPVIAVVVGLFVFAFVAGFNLGTAHAQPEDTGDTGDTGDTEDTGDTGDTGDTEPVDPAAPGEEKPTNVRLRQLEQNVQSLKERAWRSKARVGMLKEAVLGGGVGARATLVHRNKMGRAFRDRVRATTGLFRRGDPAACAASRIGKRIGGAGTCGAKCGNGA